MDNKEFMKDFNPKTSTRELRKLNQKSKATNKKLNANVSLVYDQNGIHISSGLDVCDCLVDECPGCFFPCKKCQSNKCGKECRVNRKYAYNEVEFEGCSYARKNPHKKSSHTFKSVEQFRQMEKSLQKVSRK